MSKTERGLRFKDSLLPLCAISLRFFPCWFSVYFALTLLNFIMCKYILGKSVLISLASLTAYSSDGSIGSGGTTRTNGTD